MNDHITIAVRRLAARATGRIAHWQRPLSGRMQAGDTFARQAGWSVTRTRFGGRIYRDPRFGQLSATPAAGTPHQIAHQLPAPAPPARRRVPAGRQRPGPPLASQEELHGRQDQ